MIKAALKPGQTRRSFQGTLDVWWTWTDSCLQRLRNNSLKMVTFVSWSSKIVPLLTEHVSVLGPIRTISDVGSRLGSVGFNPSLTSSARYDCQRKEKAFARPRRCSPSAAVPPPSRRDLATQHEHLVASCVGATRKLLLQRRLAAG